LDGALPQLLTLLRRKTGSTKKAEMSLVRVKDSLGVMGGLHEPILVAMALCSLGLLPQEVSRYLDWGEFEDFCAKLLLA